MRGLSRVVGGLMALAALGCATQRTSARWRVEVVPVGIAAAPAARRIEELEARLAAIERARAADAGRAAAELGAALARLEALLAKQNELARQRAEPAPVCAAPAPAADGDAEAQLRYWAGRVRAGSSTFRGGLSPAQNAALNVLARPERSLDPRNPWQDL